MLKEGGEVIQHEFSDISFDAESMEACMVSRSFTPNPMTGTPQ